MNGFKTFHLQLHLVQQHMWLPFHPTDNIYMSTDNYLEDNRKDCENFLCCTVSCNCAQYYTFIWAVCTAGCWFRFMLLFVLVHCVSLHVSTSAVNCLRRLVSKMTN